MKPKEIPKKEMFAVSVETDGNVIRIEQSMCEELAVILLAPEQVKVMREWLLEAEGYCAGEKSKH